MRQSATLRRPHPRNSRRCAKKIAKIHTAVIGLELLDGHERVEAPSSITKILMA
jgi:hypothetical protein